MMEDEEFIECVADTEVRDRDTRYLILVLYDIVDNKRRTQFAKYVSSFGFRVQKSCFEAVIDKHRYRRLVEGITPFIKVEDSIRVYKIRSKEDVMNFGEFMSYTEEEVIVI